MGYLGVREFKNGGYCATVQMEGVRTVIYTSDSAEGCASAYDEYIKVVKPCGWRGRFNNVDRCHDFDQLWFIVALVGSPAVRARAKHCVDRARELGEQHKEGEQ